MSCVPRFYWACGLMLAVAVALPLASSKAAPSEKSGAAAKSADKPAATDKKLVDLFDAMKSGDVDVKFVAKNSREGQLLVKNKTDQPLTVKLPDAFAAVPVLAQVPGGGGAGGSTRKSYGGGNSSNSQNQGVGGGGGGIGGGGGGNRGGGGGAFDVARKRSLRSSSTPFASNTARRSRARTSPTRSARSKLSPAIRRCKSFASC
jgi:hypothetical protein